MLNLYSLIAYLKLNNMIKYSMWYVDVIHYKMQKDNWLYVLIWY